jgi:hypothetical protein
VADQAPDGLEAMRSGIIQAIQEGLRGADNAQVYDNMVTRWVVIAESISPSDGKRYLTRLDGDAADVRLTKWDRRGLFHEALFDQDWGVDDSGSGGGGSRENDG